MYTFIYSNLHSHWYEDVTIHHQRTSKNITLPNFPYIHSHTESHSPDPGRRRGRRRPYSVGWT